MGGLTGMVNMQELMRLFNSTDPADREKLQQLGPGLMSGVDSRASQDPKGAPSRIGVGGGGVDAGTPSNPSPGEGGEKPSFNWGGLADTLSVGLSSIGNALGNPRAAYTPESVDMAKERLRASQVDQLNRRHSMWDDAHKQSQSLPPEVMTDPAFAGLAQAKAALDKDLMDGKIDNEKNVSSFLTEMARHRNELTQLGINTQAGQEQQLSSARAGAGAKHLEELRARAAQGDPQAQAELSGMDQPLSYQGRMVNTTPLKLSQMEQADKEKQEQQRIMEERYKRDDQLRAMQIHEMAQNHKEALQDRLDARTSKVVQGLYRNLVTQRTQLAVQKLRAQAQAGDQMAAAKLENGDLDAAQIELQSLHELTPQLFQLAKAQGVDIQEPNPGDVTSGYRVNGQPFQNLEDVSRYLFALFS